MSFADITLIILGLTLFEVISSIDNAVVNADVLQTMSVKARRWFLLYGILFAVFVVRGVLPFLIVYFAVPDITLWDAVTATFGSNDVAKNAIAEQTPALLAGGGIYLVYLFLHWLFMEKKEYAFFWETHIHKRLGFWFYTVISFILLFVVAVTMKISSSVALGAVIGSTVFFITTGFKENAEKKEQELKENKSLSDVSKIVYLEVIDTTFSIDGVLGAFAFTTSIPLILLGNGLGAFVVRYVTIKGTHIVRKYRYLKNGAMYSIGSLGAIMLIEGMSFHVPHYLSPLITFIVVGIFLWLSFKELKKEKAFTPEIS